MPDRDYLQNKIPQHYKRLSELLDCDSKAQIYGDALSEELYKALQKEFKSREKIFRKLTQFLVAQFSKASKNDFQSLSNDEFLSIQNKIIKKSYKMNVSKRRMDIFIRSIEKLYTQTSTKATRLEDLTTAVAKHYYKCVFEAEFSSKIKKSDRRYKNLEAYHSTLEHCLNNLIRKHILYKPTKRIPKVKSTKEEFMNVKLN